VPVEMKLGKCGNATECVHTKITLQVLVNRSKHLLKPRLIVLGRYRIHNRFRLDT
jgi:hypothetical protein